tara:strand:+ start:740 stop:871 length:132 start_codon:yes stop_codon:yes gene_type:complete
LLALCGCTRLSGREPTARLSGGPPMAVGHRMAGHFRFSEALTN